MISKAAYRFKILSRDFSKTGQVISLTLSEMNDNLNPRDVKFIRMLGGHEAMRFADHRARTGQYRSERSNNSL